MAFNIIAETNKPLNYELIHEEFFQDALPFELIPMPGLGKQNGDALGICIPLNNAIASTWPLLKVTIEKLSSEFGCDIYDLYGGQKLNETNILTFKQNLLGE